MHSPRVPVPRVNLAKRLAGRRSCTQRASRTIIIARRSTMAKFRPGAAFAALIGAAVLCAASGEGFAAGYVETDLVVNQQVNGVPTLTDSNGIVHVAKFFDPHLVNPWGVGESATSPFWVSDAEVGLSTLYNTAGMPQTRVVTIPAPGDPLNASGAPTGLVFNIAGGATGGLQASRVRSGGVPTWAAATLLLASEDGT